MDGESRFSAIFGQLRTLSDPLIILLISRSLVRTQQGSPYFMKSVDGSEKLFPVAIEKQMVDSLIGSY